MRLLLVRHGQTDSNVAKALDTAAPGADLTELGRAQADALVDALADERIEAIYCSPLVRTQQTAAPIAAARGLPIVVRAGIREVGAGDYEMSTAEDAIKAYIGAGQAWMRGDLAHALPGSGIDGAGTLSAFDEVVREAQRSTDGTVLVVSHGAIIRIWVATRTDNVEVDYASAHPLGNTGLVVVEGTSGSGWVTVSWAGNPITGGPPADPDDPTGGVRGS
jgi:broad specificity phosphatase PhoE